MSIKARKYRRFGKVRIILSGIESVSSSGRRFAYAQRDERTRLCKPLRGAETSGFTNFYSIIIAKAGAEQFG